MLFRCLQLFTALIVIVILTQGKVKGKLALEKKSANRTTESIEFTGITVLSKLFVKSDQKGCAVVSGEWICYNEKA